MREEYVSHTNRVVDHIHRNFLLLTEPETGADEVGPKRTRTEVLACDHLAVADGGKLKADPA